MKTSRPKTFAKCSFLEKIGRVIYVAPLIGFGVVGMWSPYIYMSLNYPEKLANSSFSFGIFLWCVGFLIGVAVITIWLFSTWLIYKKLFRIYKKE
jgi:hypothetical protein